MSVYAPVNSLDRLPAYRRPIREAPTDLDDCGMVSSGKRNGQADGEQLARMIGMGRELDWEESEFLDLVARNGRRLRGGARPCHSLPWKPCFASSRVG